MMTRSGVYNSPTVTRFHWSGEWTFIDSDSSFGEFKSSSAMTPRHLIHCRFDTEHDLRISAIMVVGIN